jgi:hypothetical protein
MFPCFNEVLLTFKVFLCVVLLTVKVSVFQCYVLRLCIRGLTSSFATSCYRIRTVGADRVLFVLANRFDCIRTDPHNSKIKKVYVFPELKRVLFGTSLCCYWFLRYRA